MSNEINRHNDNNIRLNPKRFLGHYFIRVQGKERLFFTHKNFSLHKTEIHSLITNMYKVRFSLLVGAGLSCRITSANGRMYCRRMVWSIVFILSRVFLPVRNIVVSFFPISSRIFPSIRHIAVGISIRWRLLHLFINSIFLYSTVLYNFL